MATENQREALLKLVRDAVQQDNELRASYSMGEKFRFIRDRLKALQTRIEDSLTLIQTEEASKEQKLAEDEMLVYVYLYNSQGAAIQTWQKMLNPKVFYEYSINRPIYGEQSQIDAFIRGKPNKAQYGYLTLAIKKNDIIPVKEADQMRDVIGNPLIKVREGSLRSNRLLSFTHNGHLYVLNEEGQLIRKPT